MSVGEVEGREGEWLNTIQSPKCFNRFGTRFRNTYQQLGDTVLTALEQNIRRPRINLRIINKNKYYKVTKYCKVIHTSVHCTLVEHYDYSAAAIVT